MIVGIDLGTTNSAISVWRDGAARLVPNALGDVLTPSAISILDDGMVLVGLPARDRQATHPRDTATAFKRLIGTQQKVKLGKTELLPEELSALVLKSLKADAESYLGEAVTEAVVTVPAYFNDRQRKATRRAGELAGLSVRRLLNEPTAAALAHGLTDRAERAPFLVFDLGGGTFDVSVVEMYEGIVEVRASAGDNRLGGEDFNDCLIDLVRPHLDLPENPRAIDAVVLHETLRAAAERARRTLSTADRTEFTLTIGDRSWSAEVTAADFEAHAAGLLARLRDPVLRSLRDSDIRVDALSEVVPVGGATRMPIVRRALTRMFGRFPNTTIDPDQAVALGAGIQAGLIARDAALNEVRLTDVCPFTLGVEHAQRDARGHLRHGLFSPIIERNTPIPASRVNWYETIQDGQRFVELGVYQGEAREVANNVKLGEMKIPVPPRPAGDVTVECRFSYDTSGLLEVDVTVPETGTTRSLILNDDESANAAEIEDRLAALAKLKLHPRDDSTNAALIARATRCYEGFIGDRRDAVGAWLLGFEAALASQDPRAIAAAQVELTQLLDGIEGERFL